MAYAREHWDAIRASLLAGTYHPLSRPLAGLIQQAICQVLLPIFDPHFSESSFGFRPGRSAHDAVYQVRDYIRKGYRVAVDAIQDETGKVGRDEPVFLLRAKDATAPRTLWFWVNELEYVGGDPIA